MKQEEVDQAKFIMIRHGLSKFNIKNTWVKATYGAGSKEHKACHNDPELLDPELHPIGIMQCEAAHPVVNAMDVKIIFTSPLQRTITTTIHMFKNHPNKANIKFIVLPIIREILSTTNDFAMDCDELMAKYADGSPLNHGIKFNWSRMYDYGQPSLW